MDSLTLISATALFLVAVFFIFGVLQPGLPPHPERSLGRKFWRPEAILVVWLAVGCAISTPFYVFSFYPGSTGLPSSESMMMSITAFGLALVALAQLVQWLRMRAAWAAMQQSPSGP